MADQQALTKSNTSATEIGLGADIPRDLDYEVYKGRKNVTDRIALLSMQIVIARPHYVEGAGSFFCLSDWQVQLQGERTVEVCTRPAICCEKLDYAKKRFAGLILKYNTASDGTVVNPLQDFKLLVWRFNDEKYELLVNTHKDFPLTSHDLRVSCSDEQYQRMAIAPCKEAVWRDPRVANFFASVEQWVRMMTSAAGEQDSKLRRVLGRKLPLDKVSEALGASAPVAVVSDAPLADVASMIGGLGAPASVVQPAVPSPLPVTLPPASTSPVVDAASLLGFK